MDEDAADGSGASRVDWDALTPAVERVGDGPDGGPAGDTPGSDASTDTTPDDADAEGVEAAATGDALSDAVTQAAEATGQLDAEEAGGADASAGGDRSSEAAEGAAGGGEAPTAGGDDADETDEWAALTPAVERVAPIPAVTRVEDEAAADADAANAEAEANSTAALEQPAVTPEEPSPAMKGAPDDVEQPLAVHIEEMVKRLGIVVAIAGAVSLALFPLTGEVINFLWFSILPGSDVASPHVYHPLEYKLTQLKVASLGGLLIALPVFVYQTYRFMRPGLYPHERRYYLASVPTSLVLGLLGVTFAYFVVLPAIMSYFLYYSQDVVTIAFALGATFDLILLLMGYLAVVFQIPLFVMLAIMMGLTTRQWLEGRRLIFWGAFLGVAFLFSPDPTGMAPVLVAATMVVLFEGTLLLLRWTGR
jgi:sec-independent protein translocase protein TatC